MPLSRIHVNGHKIKANKKNGTREPVITIKQGRRNTYAHEAVIRDDRGREVARVVYSPDKPLSCGATLWVETTEAVEPIRLEPDVCIECGDELAGEGSDYCSDCLAVLQPET